MKTLTVTQEQKHGTPARVLLSGFSISRSYDSSLQQLMHTCALDVPVQTAVSVLEQNSISGSLRHEDLLKACVLSAWFHTLLPSACPRLLLRNHADTGANTDPFQAKCALVSDIS